MSLAAHIINGHHEHATLYITAQKHTHKTGNLFGTSSTFYLRAKAKNKIKPFLNSVTVHLKVWNVYPRWQVMFTNSLAVQSS